jgi:O-methyltransferase
MTATPAVGTDNRGLSDIAQAVLRERLTYLSVPKFISLEGTVSAVLAADVPGDILEFGVALGGSGIVLAEYALKARRRFHGFDVFGLIPPPSSDKDDSKSKQRYNVISSGRSQGIGGDEYYGYRKDLFRDVCSTFERHGIVVDGTDVVLHKGLFANTWPHYSGKLVAFAHIDCDWYDSVGFCLEALRRKLAPGGAILLDDYCDYGGCRTATREFVATNPEFSLEIGASAVLRLPIT